jgi:predicted ATP-dependent protease
VVSRTKTELSLPAALPADAIELTLDPAWFPYTTTADVPPLEGIAGQPRAVRALEVGLGVHGGGYNIYAVGLSGASLLELMRCFILDHISQQPTPPDWVYVNNFDEADQPLAVALLPGQGLPLKKDMRTLVTRIRDELPKAFRYEGFGQEKERLREEYEQRSRELYNKLENLARKKHLSVQTTSEGQLLFLPIRDDKPLSPEEAQKLDPEELERISKQQQEIFREAQPLIEQQHELTRQMTEAIRNIEHTFAEHIIQPLIDELSARYANDRLTRWLDQVKQHMLDNLAQFRGSSQAASSPQEQMMRAMMGQPFDGHALEYEVNVLVDNTEAKGPPVLVEDVPTYKNLFGIIERTIDRFGRVSANFLQIKPGSILRANGGYLLFNLDDALSEPLVWKELKRTLKNRRIHIDTYEPISFFSTSGIKPEAIPLDVKVIVVGSPYLFHLLGFYDHEFGELFKVKADFAYEMPLNAESCRYYAQLVRRLAETDPAGCVSPFAAEAVVELVRHGARMVGNRSKVSADFHALAGLIREASFWARQGSRGPGSGVRRQAGQARSTRKPVAAKARRDRGPADKKSRKSTDRTNGEAAAQEPAVLPVVTPVHVRQALEEQVYRSNWIAEKINDLIREGTLLIDTRQQVVGQVNGLAVYDVGDYAFGKPSRVTATAWVGRAGVINIERESRLSGRTHDKGMLIMEGYLRNKYARQNPISLGASLAFEQSYSGVEGDSASAAEFFCLLSALSGVPLRQDIAVTGSVNQHGQVQAVGGVNEKIEGFFDVCRVQGLTGHQGVCFPHANLQHLILRPAVLDAVRAGRFHLWTMATLDQGLELLARTPAGDIDQPDTVHGRVYQRLQEINEALREAPSPGSERLVTVQSDGPPAPPAPPPLPPQGKKRNAER